MSLRKRQRVGSNGHLSSAGDGSLADEPPASVVLRPAAVPGGFNDPAASDVLLHLQLDGSDEFFVDLHLKSSALRRSGYFSALLSGRWQRPATDPSPSSDEDSVHRRVTLKISFSSTLSSGDRRRRGPFDAHVVVLRLLHTLDFSGEVASVADALDLIPVALELLFDECVQACVRYLEAVPWTEEEEEGVLKVIPLLRQEESRELIARLSPLAAAYGDGMDAPEKMLHGLIDAAIRRHPNVATIKAFVAKLLRDYAHKDSVRKVLDTAFLASLETVKEYLGKYASPDFRVAGDNDEREAMQRLNLHAAMMNLKHLHWLVERMIDSRVADNAVKLWGEQPALAGDLQKTFREDGWKNMAPGLPLLITRCTFRLANSVASGVTLASKEVRMRLVKEWLPVLNVCKDILPVPPFPDGHKTLYHELEETFLGIISTLPVSDAQPLLQQCLSFSTRNVDDCPHLIRAFKTWFRRANRAPHVDNNETHLLD